MKKKKIKKQVCIVCGIDWVEGRGFVGKHIPPCANARYGWGYVKDVEKVN